MSNPTKPTDAEWAKAWKDLLEAGKHLKELEKRDGGTMEVKLSIKIGPREKNK